jgi:CubicO group peptidase (beta-lactamase class C family)
MVQGFSNPTGDPMHGTVHPDFDGLAEVFRRQLERERVGGAGLCVYHRGQPVVDLWGGTRDEHGRPWQEDTLGLCYSTTKGVAATLLHVLADRGLLDYRKPVSHYWPEFAAAGKAGITVRQVLCHEAGLYGIREMVDHAHRLLDWDHMVERLAAAAPRHLPGTAHGYHGLTFGFLVGELAQRVTGERFADLLAKELVAPLQLDGLFVGVPENALGRRSQWLATASHRSPQAAEQGVRRIVRVSRMLRTMGLRVDLRHTVAALMPAGITELDVNSEAFARASIPSHNGMFTARSLARLYALLAGQGRLGPVRLLSRKTFERAIQVQSRSFDRVVPAPMHWRLGYHRVVLFPERSGRAFGHFGYGGSGAWADPDRELSLALVVNRGAGTPFGDGRIGRVSRAAVRCADRRGRHRGRVSLPARVQTPSH